MEVRRSGARMGSVPKPKPPLVRPPRPLAAWRCRTAERFERTVLMLMRRSRIPSPATAPDRELAECSRSSRGWKRSASAAAGVLVTMTGEEGSALDAAAAAGEPDSGVCLPSASVGKLAATTAVGTFFESGARFGLEGTEAVVSSRTWFAGNQPSRSSSAVRLRPYHQPPSGCLWTWTSCPIVRSSSSCGRWGEVGDQRESVVMKTWAWWQAGSTGDAPRSAAENRGRLLLRWGLPWRWEALCG